MRKLLRLSVTACAVAALAFAARAGDPPPGPTAPEPAVSFPVTDVFQMRPTKEPIPALRGRVLLVMFIGTRYEKCTDAVADINALHDRLGPRGLTVLGIAAEEERTVVDAWIKKNGVKHSVAIVDTPTQEGLILRKYPCPGYPWAFLLDVKGNIVWKGQPQNMRDEQVTPLLDAAWMAPILPPALIDIQPMLDGGTWAKARTALLAAADPAATVKLSKADLGWAKGVAKWIEMRRPKTLEEAEAFLKQEWYWDAWWAWDDYTRRFEGLEGCDVARQKADEVRKVAAAADDLKMGDDIAKAKEALAKGNVPQAKLILSRIAKMKNRFGDRAKDILANMGK